MTGEQAQREGGANSSIFENILVIYFMSLSEENLFLFVKISRILIKSVALRAIFPSASDTDIKYSH